MHITFVCSGNTCRSPLALAAWEVVARGMSDDCRAQLARVALDSAGLNARAGAAATPMAQLIAAGWDADLSKHRARNWRAPDSMNAADAMIVAMTTEQAAQIRFRLEAQRAARDATVITLGEFLTRDARNHAPSWSDAEPDARALDIPDPYGGSSEAYEECGARILRGVRALIESYCRQ